jgi:hypothetical protein
LVALRFWSRFDSGAASSAAYRATNKLRRPERGRRRSGAGWCAADARAHGVGGDGLDGCEGRQGGEAEPSLRVLTVRSNVSSRETVCVGPLTDRWLRRCASAGARAVCPRPRSRDQARRNAVESREGTRLPH